MPGMVVCHAGIADNERDVQVLPAAARGGAAGRSGRLFAGPTEDALRQCWTSPRSSGRIRRSGMLRRDARAPT